MISIRLCPRQLKPSAMSDHPGRCHMSTQNRVRRKVKDIFATALNFEEEEWVETGGIAFPDGHCIELVKDDVGSLAFLDSKSKKFDQRIDLAGQVYVPPILAPSVLEALTLPTK